MAEYFITQLARVTGARDDERNAIECVQTRNGQAEPLQFVHRRLRWAGPDDLFE